MKTDRQKEIERRIELKSYLAELTILLGRTVTASELLSLEKTDQARLQSIGKLHDIPAKVFKLPFKDLRSEHFTHFVRALYERNACSVFVWMDRTRICGLLEASSIKSINFGFDFSSFSASTLVMTTTDLRDKLLLDWHRMDGSEGVQLEVSGLSWPQAVFAF